MRESWGGSEAAGRAVVGLTCGLVVGLTRGLGFTKIMFTNWHSLCFYNIINFYLYFHVGVIKLF